MFNIHLTANLLRNLPVKGHHISTFGLFDLLTWKLQDSPPTLTISTKFEVDTIIRCQVKA